MPLNIFNDQPEFIQTDPRTDRPDAIAYRIDPDFMYVRHEILLPQSIFEGKTVLDLGSCNAASGAWALSNGAKSYTGVELQPGYVTQSKENLAKYYSADRWNITQLSIEEFLSKPTGKFDIVIALGVAHAFANVGGFLNAIAARSQYIAIDGTHPYTIMRSPFLNGKLRAQLMSTPDYVRFIENEPFIAMHQTGMSLRDRSTVLYDGYVPSMGFMTQILQKAGFVSTPGVNDTLKQRLPNVYSPAKKFGLSLVKNVEGQQPALGLAQNIATGKKMPTVKWQNT
ncbi:MAG: class I SAM-dependent methyltransferase [Parvibaculum sp.]